MNSTEKVRVLYAEDESEIADMVLAYFRHAAPECEIEVVETGFACLDRMKKGGIDVLVLDLVLPDINGLRILGELAASGDTTPVIMASGHGQTELAVRALRAGAIDCLDKTTPQFRDLPGIVRRAHARSRAKVAAPRSRESKRQHRVMLVEASAQIISDLKTLFAENAPELSISVASSEEDFARLLAAPDDLDAAIIGPNPGNLDALTALRRVRSRSVDTAVIVIAPANDAEKAIATFKLGARDFILLGANFASDVLYSLNNCLRNADTEQRNAELTRELADLNRSLESQVEMRTSELQIEVAVRKDAEKNSEEYAKRLQILSARLIRAQEDERRAIARELHDQVGQTLTGLKFQLESAVAAATPSAKASLAEALGLANEMLRQVRELTQQFRPRILDDLGLRPALEWHAGLYQRQTGIAVVLDISVPEARLPAELETAAFRVVQESLTNVARHAGSPSATVTVMVNDRKLLVEITDRGRGFDPAAVVASRESIGLTGLEERVKLAGGQLEIFSRPGQGTRVHAAFPITAMISVP